jgi:hypothetical protein
MGIILGFESPSMAGGSEILTKSADEVFDSDHYDRTLPYALGSDWPLFRFPSKNDQNVRDWLGEDGAYHFDPTIE